MFIFMWACASLDCNITEASMLVVGLVMSTRGKIYPYFFFGVLLWYAALETPVEFATGVGTWPSDGDTEC